MKNLPQLFPAAVLQQELIREAVSGRQAYHIYLGKHSVGKNVEMSDGAILFHNSNTVNHFGLSSSSQYTKASVPLVFSGVIVNFVEIALELFQRLSKMVVHSEHALVVYRAIVMDKKALLVHVFTNRICLENHPQYQWQTLATLQRMDTKPCLKP